MGNRSIITMECSACKERNYSTTKNKKKTQDKLNLSKSAWRTAASGSPG
jgi:large subunit ribosomal protein L33